jgi:hypothetical protein
MTAMGERLRNQGQHQDQSPMKKAMKAKASIAHS